MSNSDQNLSTFSFFLTENKHSEILVGFPSLQLPLNFLVFSFLPGFTLFPSLAKTQLLSHQCPQCVSPYSFCYTRFDTLQLCYLPLAFCFWYQGFKQMWRKLNDLVDESIKNDVFQFQQLHSISLVQTSCKIFWRDGKHQSNENWNRPQITGTIKCLL